MRIHRDQFDVFVKQTQREFCSRMVTYMREHFPRRVGMISQPALLTWTHAALAVCERGGIDREPHAAQLILLLMALGLDSADCPWVEATLAEPGLGAEDKLRRVIREVRARRLQAIDDVVVYDDLDEVDDV